MYLHFIKVYFEKKIVEPAQKRDENNKCFRPSKIGSLDEGVPIHPINECLTKHEFIVKIM
ncbi:hypothetical protein C6345_17340 [Bacillus sp. LNXM12-2]|nr:hypothetical protein DKE43_09170 [Bacillus pumilus]PRS49126.1 hypothetical protein C6Y05_12020 [Bacillus sp. LNXM10]PRS51774.1 hypothetical protein C6Y06_12325 [Bacillus sp. MZGC1]PRS56523.1 hypothetical protein C6Y00_00925 [Bacillus sp. GBSC66]PRS61968.1 hypothetical protein C6344_08820 [Bacillus sp. GBSW19]PRS67315.1 hypothetical protein C6347_14565 [Bacillus sp. NMTD17]PRS76006.1 hypothetical protein C6Y04_12210 [Bacillus sp. GBSW2]PRS77761.1 hypothetical protein C6346_16710 [Bacillus 